MGWKQGTHVLSCSALGRVIRPCIQNKDHEHVEEAQAKPVKTPTPRPHKPAGPSDPLAIRIVVISGLPTGIDSKTLWKKVRKLQGAEKVEWPVKADSGEEDPSVGAYYGLSTVERQHALIL